MTNTPLFSYVPLLYIYTVLQLKKKETQMKQHSVMEMIVKRRKHFIIHTHTHIRRNTNVYS